MEKRKSPPYKPRIPLHFCSRKTSAAVVERAEETNENKQKVGRKQARKQMHLFFFFFATRVSKQSRDNFNDNEEDFLFVGACQESCEWIGNKVKRKDEKETKVRT